MQTYTIEGDRTRQGRVEKDRAGYGMASRPDLGTRVQKARWNRVVEFNSFWAEKLHDSHLSRRAGVLDKCCVALGTPTDANVDRRTIRLTLMWSERPRQWQREGTDKTDGPCVWEGAVRVRGGKQGGG